MQTFDVSLDAVNQAMSLGLGEDTDDLVSLIANFARSSALVTHPKGNHRYGGYILEIDGMLVYKIAKFNSSVVCPECHGTGMHHQRDSGRWVDVPCQNPTCSERSVAYG